MGRGSGSRSDYNDVTSIAVDAGVMDGIFFNGGILLSDCINVVVWSEGNGLGRSLQRKP